MHSLRKVYFCAEKLAFSVHRNLSWCRYLWEDVHGVRGRRVSLRPVLRFRSIRALRALSALSPVPCWLCTAERPPPSAPPHVPTPNRAAPPPLADCFALFLRSRRAPLPASWSQRCTSALVFVRLHPFLSSD